VQLLSHHGPDSIVMPILETCLVIIPVGPVAPGGQFFLTSAPTTLGDEVIQRQSLGKRAPDTEPIAARECIPGGDQPSEGTTMRHLLAAMAAFALMTGVALAQGAPGSGSSTTTATSGPNGSSTTTTKQGTGWNGNAVSKQDAYKQGAAGSSETHSKTETDPASGGTTTSKTTTTRP
jgi:hypothetical protein